MSHIHDIFLRAHTVPLDKPKRRKKANGKKFKRKGKCEKWLPWAVVFDCESRVNTGQQLTFGFYRVLELRDGTYELYEEGAFYDADLSSGEVEVLSNYCRTTGTEVRTFPPNFPLYSRSEFVTKIFYKYARKGAMIVGFNLGFDLSRLARKWPEGEKNEWSLVLSEHPDGTENPHCPRVLIDPIDSKKAFISFQFEWVPDDGKSRATKIAESRFLDIRTLLWSLFNVPYSLKLACDNEKGPFKGQNLPQKLEDGASGEVTLEEIEYAKQDVKCTAALLNACKKEFDRHPTDLHPDKSYSPASVAKSYLEKMGIIQPTKKFKVPDKILGIAMESYLGGRSETRVRHAEVPVVPVDFTSEYPSTCALLNLWEIITAESLSFRDATEEIRSLVEHITLEECFKPEQWADFRFFALVQPKEDIFPVRTKYNGSTANIGSSYFSSQTPIWMAGPDVIAAKILTGKPPKVLRAIRIQPHRKQTGMSSIDLMGLVEIDPYKDDLFRKVIEQRKLNKKNKELYYWLKILANSIYGFFVEINPEPMPQRNPIRVHVYSGEESFVPDKRFAIAENQGRWYAPYLAAQITSGGRLLLAMLEASVTKVGGTYAWADTDALAIVSSENAGSLAHVPGCENVRALSWKEVDAIVGKFELLNPYDRYAVPGSILNLTDDNWVDPKTKEQRRHLLGFSISAKRYVVYEREGENITIINPKAHGLGYLYPPIDSPKGWDEEHDAPKWIHQFWDSLLRTALNLPRKDPSWFARPQMMRMTVTTQNVLRRLHGWQGFRPYNFFLLPVLADCGYPANCNPKHFTLVAPFESDQEKWTDSVCINISDADDEQSYRLTTDFGSPDYGKAAVVKTFKDLLYRYLEHPEAKSVAPDGSPSGPKTRGLLGRVHVIAGTLHRIGKETDRKWEEGDDLESLLYEPIVYERRAAKAITKDKTVADESLIRQIRKIGIRELVRFGCGRRVLEKICRREIVENSTLQEYAKLVREYKLKKK